MSKGNHNIAYRPIYTHFPDRESKTKPLVPSPTAKNNRPSGLEQLAFATSINFEELYLNVH